MAARDIMPVSGPLGGHYNIVHYPVAASADFEEGEVISLTAGEANEATDDQDMDTELAFVGIAAVSSDALEEFHNVATTALNGSGVTLPVYPFAYGTQFRSSNFATDGAGTAATLKLFVFSMPITLTFASLAVQELK
jgi:hypothetical protein